MLERVFIANRGEIAVRIVRACRALGLECVVGVSDADRDEMAARLADRAVCLGPGPAASSYLREDVIVQAALGTHCDAIHPGYGFLSESAALARLTEANGLRFVGPPAAVIELAGDKLRAREVAHAAGLPVLPGRAVGSVEEARALSGEIGFPLLLKAAGGGGGRGIKLVRDPERLPELFALASAEALAAFGDGRVYLERYVSRARHVEVQIAADEYDHVVHLGERDCSVQRRYQKIVEEAPAPELLAEVRAALCLAAVTLARALGYRNLGTVEFVLDADSDAFYFLEVNSRIQVEHPVTELVTGLDLVVMQLRIAAGEPLDLEQTDVTFLGHAVQARLCAEDPAHDFRPVPGTLSAFEVPALPGLRVDTHCGPGAAIPPYYDSLMAKVIAHADDRPGALALLADALERSTVEGVASNRAFLAGLLRSDDLQRGPVTTDWLTGVTS